MATGKWIAYYRVSTDRQGKSGLGLEAQRAAVSDFLDGGRWKLVKTFTEVESGKRADRPQLAAALAACRLYKAKLIIAKLDRLSRDAHFLLGLEKAGVEFEAADLPNANRLTVGLLAVLAEHERELISQRTKDALAAAKARGTRLGGKRQRADGTYATFTPEISTLGRQAHGRLADARAQDIRPMIQELRARGATTLRDLAEGLNEAGITAPRGGRWTAVQVARLLKRLP